jgi:hypothetical protein
MRIRASQRGERNFTKFAKRNIILLIIKSPGGDRHEWIMSENDLIDFGIWRDMDADITDEDTKQEALQASLGAIEELKQEGVDVEWVSTDVLEDPESDGECAYCHYRAPSEEAIKEHSDRAGLPVTRLTRMNDQLGREEAE